MPMSSALLHFQSVVLLCRSLRLMTCWWPWDFWLILLTRPRTQPRNNSCYPGDFNIEILISTLYCFTSMAAVVQVVAVGFMDDFASKAKVAAERYSLLFG